MFVFRVCFAIFAFIVIKLARVEAEIDCPTLVDADNLSQTQLVEKLTHGCRYDRLERPTEPGPRRPLDVFVRAYIYFLQNLEAHDLQFKIHALLQFRFLDPRLAFRKVAPKRRQPILGERALRDHLWMPHIFLANEKESSILGTSEKDILTSVSPDGTVIISSRIKSTLYCWMNLQKFPFDEQACSIVLESWMYNTSELVLHWEQKRPITFDPALHLTEFVLKGAWSNETVINADWNDLRHGAFAGNYSSLSFTVHLTRQVGFYMMDYFLPSVLIVGISWVSFWLQADQAPPRIMLGTSTMLTFITLASAQGKTLPKVSYIKVSEVWFLGCTIFIVGSLLEFAFVNTIWRRKEQVDVKKMNSKHILKSTLSPRASRRRSTVRSRSLTTVVTNDDLLSLFNQPNFNNYLTVHSFPITTITEGQTLRNNSVTKIDMDGMRMRSPQNSNQLDTPPDLDNNDNATNGDDNGCLTLTSQEISMWIDRRARCIFPSAFLVFNVFFWTFVYVV